MKKFNQIVKYLLLVLAIGLTVTSCKEEEETTTINFHVDITNLRDETVYFFIEEDGTTQSIQSEKVFTWDLTKETQTGYVTVGVKLASGKILDWKEVRNGEIYSVVVNKDNSDTNVSDEIETWKLIVELTNYSSNSVYLYIDGEQKKIIGSEQKLSYSPTITNQTKALVEIKNAEGVILSSKTVKKGESFVETINDPVFTINKIVLTKWDTDNIFDTPDPWIKVSINDIAVGRTNYLSDVNDGSLCTFSNLSIKIDQIYNTIAFDLYDYDTGYSSGSDYISGLYSTKFDTYWKKDSFTMKTANMELIIYGTWE